MKYAIIFSILFSAIIFSSCGEEFNGLTPEEYIAENMLLTKELDQGVHIVIENLGNSNRPNINSRVIVAYEGKLTDGTTFDSNNNLDSFLSGLIRGWQIGLPEIGVGGKCTLIIPPNAGYGSRGKGGVPGNATMVFEMELKDIIL